MMTNKKIPGLSAGENERGVLSVFAEIRKTKMLRGLTFLAVAYAYNNKNNDGYNIRSHFEKLLNAYAEIGNIVVNNEKSAEKY